MHRQCSFFAIRDDLTPLLRNVATKRSFELVCVDNNAEKLDRYNIENIRNDFSISPYGDQALDPYFLLVRPGVRVQPRQVRQRDGSTRFVVDQDAHPESVYLRFGGEFANGIIIAGQFGTISNDIWSDELYNLLASRVSKGFVKIKSYFVGPSAARALESGARLTARARSPREYDLSR